MSIPLRFVLDQDVSEVVGKFLRSRRMKCWSVAKASLSDASDQQVLAYAMKKNAVVITHDKDFGLTQRSPAGQVVVLRCHEWYAAEILESWLDPVLADLKGHPDVTVHLTRDKYRSVTDRGTLRELVRPPEPRRQRRGRGKSGNARPAAP